MSTETVGKLKINDDIVTVTLKVDKVYLSPGDIVTAHASFSQKGKNLGLFVTSECAIGTPVNGPLEILETRETCIRSDIDPKLSIECERINKYYFSIPIDAAIIQASGVFVSHNKRRHHIITGPLLVKMGKQSLPEENGQVSR
jgi:hypothetical protein